MLLNYLLVPNLARIPLTFGTVGLSSLFRRRITQEIWIDRTNEIVRKEKKVFLIDHEEKWEEILPLISRDVGAVNAVGFDSEWICKNGKRNPVALLQLATYSGYSVVIRLNHLQGVPPSLRDILENRKIVKVGVGCEQDDRNLTLDYNINVKGWMDLRHLALQENVTNMKFSLDSLARHYLGRNLDKNWKLKASNWESHTLAQRQVTYAAEDATVGLHILLIQLNRLWNPVHEERWEKLTCRAIKEICEPFLEMDFQYRREFGAENNTEGREKLQDLNCNYRRYNNYENRPCLQSPDGKFLDYCQDTKALWYIEKGLGDLVSESPLIVRLKFKPNERVTSDKSYRDILANEPKICFVCGKKDSFIFKNIIPFEYRKHFPYLLLSQVFDIVILCYQCLKVNCLKDHELSMKLTEECNEIARNAKLNIIRNASETLKNRNQLSVEQIHNLEKTLKDYFETDTLTEDLLTQASVLQTPKVEHIIHNDEVFKYYEKVGLIHLEKRCRQWFLDSMKPKFMPKIWSVSHNIDWLKSNMSQYPLDHVIRKDYKIALVGTEGEIDVPYVPKIRTPKTDFNISDSKDYKVSQPCVKR